mgnify:CR=1 FL=1
MRFRWFVLGVVVLALLAPAWLALAPADVAAQERALAHELRVLLDEAHVFWAGAHLEGEHEVAGGVELLVLLEERRERDQVGDVALVVEVADGAVDEAGATLREVVVGDGGVELVEELGVGEDGGDDAAFDVGVRGGGVHDALLRGWWAETASMG